MVKNGITPEFEKDFIDVSFDFEGKPVIGEIKVTGFLSLNQAFRVALGQLLEYAHLRFDTPPQMIMFLDGEPDARRVALATKYSLAIVVEGVHGYKLLNPVVAGRLQRIFDPGVQC